MSEEVARDIGEIKGTLQGVRDLIAAGQEATNRRIEDMQTSSNRRLDDLTTAINSRLASQSAELGRVKETADQALTIASEAKGAISTLKRSATIHGAGAGSIIAAGIEIARHFLKI